MFEFEPAHAAASIDQLRLPATKSSLIKVGVQQEAKTAFEDQFCVFQFGADMDGPTLVEPAKVKPSLDGSEKSPDVRAALELVSFHVGAGEEIDKDMRATMRLNFGKDEQSTDTVFKTVFWSIAAGLKLYDAATSDRAQPSDLSFSSRTAFGKRPIEIPGGLGLLSFEVVKHQEPQWYQKIFRFLGGKTGETLVSLLGFPAISLPAIRAVDQLLERLKKEPPLFESRPLRLALSEYSRDALKAGNDRVRVGVLARGYNVFARGRDFDRFNEEPMVYYSQHDRLVPRDIPEAKVLAGAYEDPLRDVTYAVCRVGLRECKLDPSIDFTVD